MPAKPLRRPAHLELAHKLGVDIATGRTRPGTVLPGEIELAERLGMSRNVIREALRMLAGKGLVESRPRIGTTVRARQDWNLLDPELLDWMFEGLPSLEFVRSLFQLRLIVEPAAAELAAAFRTAEQLSRMGHALVELADLGMKTERGRDADRRFHAVLLEASSNELLTSLSSSIFSATRRTTFFERSDTPASCNSLTNRRVLFEMIVNSDGPGARLASAKLVVDAQQEAELATKEARQPCELPPSS